MSVRRCGINRLGQAWLFHLSTSVLPPCFAPLTFSRQDMDDKDFHRYPKNQHSGNSAAPLPAAAQYHEDRAGAPVVPEPEDRQPEWPLHNPLTTSFFSRDEGDSSAQSIHPLPPVPQEITPIGIQAVHPDPRARQLSILRTTSIRPENGLDWIIPREENLEKVSRAF